MENLKSNFQKQVEPEVLSLRFSKSDPGYDRSSLFRQSCPRLIAI
jgi:hypothetical protein